MLLPPYLNLRDLTDRALRKLDIRCRARATALYPSFLFLPAAAFAHQLVSHPQTPPEHHCSSRPELRWCCVKSSQQPNPSYPLTILSLHSLVLRANGTTLATLQQGQGQGQGQGMLQVSGRCPPVETYLSWVRPGQVRYGAEHNPVYLNTAPSTSVLVQSWARYRKRYNYLTLDT